MNTPLKRKLVIGMTIVLACLTALVIFRSSKSEPTAQEMSALAVEVVVVEQKDVPIYSEWIG
jgi:hypothetical protein